MDYMEIIKVDMYAAMKSGDKDKAVALRTLLAKLKDKQINTRKDLTEKECISVIKTLVKQRLESIEVYEKAGRASLAVKEKLEFDILNAYLPTMMDEKEIRQLVQSVIIETNAKALSEIGKVMPIIMQKGGSKIDGKIANQVFWKDKQSFLIQSSKLNSNKINQIFKKTYNLEVKMKNNSIVNKTIIFKKLLLDIYELSNAS